jgi:hypothetical protein
MYWIVTIALVHGWIGMGGSLRAESHPDGLDFDYVLGLQPFGSFGDRKFHGLSFAQRFDPRGLDRRVMNENVIAGSATDESVALRVVKPLYCPLFLIHVPLNLFVLNFLGPLYELHAENK